MSGDPIEVMLNSPRSKLAIERLGYDSNNLQYLNKEQLKARLGNMSIPKAELA
jgi:hypothetical protein